MTHDEAVTLATNWWISKMKAKHWDNGDPASEVWHAMQRDVKGEPNEEEWLVILLAIDSAHRRYAELYCDYECYAIDVELRALGSRFDTRILGPQKAGTKIEKVNNKFHVYAKSGYGKPMERLDG